MKTLDNNVPFLEEGEAKTKEKIEALQPAIQIMKETAEKFRSLEQEAKTEKDAAICRQKLEERAQLLINLPSLLSGKLEGLDLRVKQRVVHDIEWFATNAKEALDNNESNFILGTLLTHQGSRNTDKNYLENLIDLIEK